MTDMDFTFDETPWEQAMAGLKEGDCFSAARLLTLVEGEDEWALEEAFQALEDRRITLTVGDLPVEQATGATALRLRQEQQLVKKGRLPEDLEETDPLRLYLEELSQTACQGDPAVLCQNLNEETAEKLVGTKLSRVVALSMEAVGKGVLLLDLIQEGSLGLWQGVLQYQGEEIHSYCDWWIRQYLARAITTQARAGGVGRRLRQAMEDYRDVDRRLLDELGRNPTLEEIAEELHMDPQEAQILLGMIQATRADQKVHAQKEKYEESPEDNQAVEDTAYFQSRQRILEMLSTLEHQEAELLRLRFGLEGGLPLDPKEVGRRLGLTPEEVVAKEAAALKKLRQET